MNQKNLVINTFVFEELLKAGQYQIDWLEGIKDLGMMLFYAVPDTLIQGSLIEERKLREYFEEYRLLGSKQFKIVAGYTDGLSDQELTLLADLMAEYGVDHLALENDQADYSTPTKMRAIIEALREAGISAGITFDTGNFIITGQSPLECAQELKDIVTFIHMKNVDAETGAIRLFDQGDVPMLEVLSVFDDEVKRAIEYPCGAEPFETVKGEIEKLG